MLVGMWGGISVESSANVFDSCWNTWSLLLGMGDRAVIGGYMLEDYGEVLGYDIISFS